MPRSAEPTWLSADEMLLRRLVYDFRHPASSRLARSRWGGRARPSQVVPERVLVAGDWHVNLDWALDVVEELPEALPAESPRLLLHLGDFGVFDHPQSVRYLDDLDAALAEADAELWFVDGNHEDFALLKQFVRGAGATDPVAIRDRITWLRRGYRWNWHGRTWLALGGGVSVDRVARTRGLDWWPQESITTAQAKRVIADGPADVMVCHDAPTAVPLELPQPSDWWHHTDLRRADRNRAVLQSVVDEVRPSYLLHGHYDLHHHTEVQMAHGPVTVTGFDRDVKRSGRTQSPLTAGESVTAAARPRTHQVLDVRTMTFLG